MRLKVALLGGAVLASAACRYEPRIEAATPVATIAPVTTVAPATTTSTVATSTAPPGPVRWRLFAAGDVKIDPDDVGIDPLGAVRPPLRDADLAVVNVEMAIGEPTTAGTAATKQFTFLGPPAAASLLARAGVDVASLANNHSLDFGVTTLLGTAGLLRDAGVSPVGAGRNATDAYAPVIRSVAGDSVRVAVVAASRVWPDASWAATADRIGLASAYDVGRISRAVRDARKNADVVIAFIHWGEESSSCPSDEQRTLAAALRRAGAAAVLGSHPHVLQPLQRDGDGVVAYSLGNFVFDRRTGPSGETIVLELVFDGARLVDVVAHPHALDSGKPRPVSRTSNAGMHIGVALNNPCI